MTVRRRPLGILIAATLMAAACGPAPDRTASAPPSVAPQSATPAPSLADVPFAPTAYPADGSACTQPGYAGEIGRIAATDANTVTFTLCAPDGAFLARLAHPSLGIVDTAALVTLAADPASAQSISGVGPYRVVAWNVDNVRLERVGAASRDAASATVILRWAADPEARLAALQAASVDGMDLPSAADMDAVATSPQLVVAARPGLATAYLGFGRGAGFDPPAVRAAIAMGINRTPLLAAFAPGSSAADWMAPCLVPAGCDGTGTVFPSYDGPAAAAALKAAKLDLTATWPLHIPDAPVPGLPDPAGTAAALQAQVAADLGLQLAVDVMPLATFRSSEAAGTLDGLYLDGFTVAVPDAAAFLAPLVTDAPGSMPAKRSAGVGALLASAAAAADGKSRAAILVRAAAGLRKTLPVVPLVHAGSAAIFRSDVTGLGVAPLGNDPLGAMTAADRRQVVFVGAGSPTGGWCGDQPSADAYRLCGMVSSGLYGYDAGALVPVPRLASSCAPDPDPTTWTCHLRAARDAAGRPLDAGDVVATFRAMWDVADPVHLAAAPGAFSAWLELFGGFVDTSIPTPSASTAPRPTVPGTTVPATGVPVSTAPAATASAKP